MDKGWEIGLKKGGTIMFKTGEKHCKGTYVYTTHGQVVKLDDSTYNLPPCPKCTGTSYRKI